MKVSLITVSFNSESTIRDTFESVKCQRFIGFDFEYILIDGGSTDSTMSIAEEYKDIISTQVSEKDKGIYNAMNKGLVLATGDIVGILNSDDTFAHTEVLQQTFEAFNDHDCDATYGDLNYVKRSSPSRIVRKWVAGMYSKNSFRLGWMPPHPTFFIKKSFYERYGGFDESISGSADYELMLRMIFKNKARLHYIPSLLVNMKDGGNSSQSLMHRFKIYNQDRLAWRKNFSTSGIIPVTFKILRKLNQFVRCPLSIWNDI